MKYLKIVLFLFIVFMLTSCTTKKYDLSGVIFEDKTVYYDGNEHMIYVSGDIPEGVDVHYNQKGAIGIGIYTITATFTVDHKTIGEKTATLTILAPERLNIYMKDKTVVYDGNEHTINPEGDLPSDLVIVNQSKYVNAGEYVVTCTIQSESVFIPEDQRTLQAKLTIEKAVIDTSSIVFSQTEFVFDNEYHSISVVSGLPRGVEAIFDNNEQRLIGTYDVTVRFTVNQNYVQPEPMNLELKIVKPADMYIITFIDGDNTYEVYMKKGEEASLPQPTPVKGYIAKWDQDLTLVTSDMTVTRELEILNYLLGVDWGEAIPYESYQFPEYINVETGEISLLTPRTPENVAFEGWYTSPTFEENTKIDVIPAGIGAEGHFNIYAKTIGYRIEETNGYTINEYGNYAKKLYQESNQVSIITFEISENATMEVYTDANCQNKIEGYELTLQEGKNYHYVKVSNGNYSYVYTIETEWVNGFEVYYHSQGDNVVKVTYAPMTLVTELSPCSVYGYTFNCWRDENGILVDSLYESYGYLHLYADLSPIEYDIIYNNVPEGIVNDNIGKYTIETEYDLLDLEKIGYTFVGWYADGAYLNKVEKIEKGTSETLRLFAKFEASQYKVTIEDVSYDVTYDTSFTLDVREVPGKIFNGYYTQLNGNGTQITDASGASLNIYNIASDVTLYPYYSLIDYSITYHIDDENAPANRTYTVEDVIELPTLKKVGHTFDGWYTNEEYTGDKLASISNSYQNLDLYARFTPNTYNVTVNGTTIDVTFGTNFTVEFEEVKGMKFEGYYTGENGAGQKVTGSDGASNGGYSIAENVTLYPYYTLETYNITYEDKNGLLVDPNYEYQYEYNINSEEIILPELYINNGEFIGWYDNADCEGDVITSIPSGSTGNKVFYAKFEYSSFTITYTDYDKIIVTYDTLGGSNVSSSTMSVGTRLTKPYWNPEKEGYLFTGWYKDKECTEIFLFDENLYADTTLYAGWYKPTYTCENTNYLLDASEHNASYSTINQTLSKNSIYKWSFVALDNKEVLDSSAYSIYYKQSQGSQVYFQYDISLYNVTQGVQVFSETYSGTGYKGQQFTANAGDVFTLTITYPGYMSVTESKATFYFGNFNDINENTYFENSTEVAYGETFTLPVRTVKGATFVGYFTEKDGKGTKVTDEFGASLAPFTFTEPLLVYPYYDCPKYTISYDLGGVEVPNTVKFIYEYDVTTPKRSLPNLSISGYTFGGWYANADFTGEKLTMIPQDADGDLVFYADITANEYNLYVSYADSVTVTFVPQDNGNNKDKTVTLSKSNPKLTVPTFYARTGYVLAGWYKEAECINEYKFNEPILEDFTLYAKWERLDENYNSTINVINPENYVYVPNQSSQNNYYSTYVYKNYYTYITIKLNQDYLDDNGFYVYYCNIWGGTTTDYAYYMSVYNQTTTECIQEEMMVSYNSTYKSIYITGNEGDIIYLKFKAYNNSTMPYLTFLGYQESQENTAAVGYSTSVKYYSTYTIDIQQVPGLRVDGLYTQKNGEGKLYIDSKGNPVNPHYDNLGDVVVYAYLTTDPYQIHYETNGGELVDPEYKYVDNYRLESEDIVLPVLQKTGYTFDGWFTNENYEGNAIDTIKNGSFGDLYLYAKFTPMVFNVSSIIAENATVYFDPQNGEEVYSVELSGDQVLQIPTEPTYDGYFFLGWFKDQECTEKYNFDEIVSPGMTLFGGWEKSNAIKINPSACVDASTGYRTNVYSSNSTYQFILNQNTEENPLVIYFGYCSNYSSPSNYSYYVSIYNLTTGETIRERYQNTSFWGTDLQFNVKGNAGDIISIVLSAYKNSTQANIYFDGYISQESTSSLILSRDATYDTDYVLDVPSIEGKTFVGYFTEENGQGTQITDSLGKSISQFTFTNDLVVYAHYEEIVE